MNQFALATLALLAEAVVGYPAALQAMCGHPVQWAGKLISYLDDGLNDPEASARQNRINGVVAVIVLLIAVAVPAAMIARLLAALPFGWVINAALATTLIAQKSLISHVAAVAGALPNSLSLARQEVGKIVGRDPSVLSEGGVAKAALESLAENASDGVVAPVLWYALLGLPGLAAYKAINTADSMIGHKSEKYLNFGWAAARLDDVLNLPASRLTGLLFTLAARASGQAAMMSAWAAMRRDAAKHNSPNAGWPEAAMAGALGFTFGGPRNYHGEVVDLATMGHGREPRDEKDIEAGLGLFRNAMALLAVIGAILAIAL
ncbi:MAG: cobalamin biosynthesis protein CobD [Alphaproteobacteria bacterium]|nr:cobalamin biosynthesis protein CobD [Alphaproteobacteria bacterium]